MRLPSRLLRRKFSAHKGDFGHIFILAGSARFSGAAVLCAEGAMRAGAGLVTLGIPKGINSAVIKIKPKEVMTLPLPQTHEGSLSITGLKKIQDFIKKVDVLAVGPGLSQNKSTQALIRRILIKTDKPIIVDADGLNAVYNLLCHCEKSAVGGRLRGKAEANSQPCNGIPRFARNRLRNLILTPHPGEMARLLDITIEKVQSNRKGVAREFARKHKVTLVLKGHNTVVADYKGNLYINKTGNPGMATAGSGDVLTGIIGAFLGQGLDAFNAAKYAAYLHGLAGDLAAKQKSQMGMIASDIINKIPAAFRQTNK